MSSSIERISTGVPEVDQIMGGGIPQGFLVAVTGEPGTGKTIFAIHFMAQGIKDRDLCIYVTTEESRESIIKQAAQFGFDFKRAMEDKRLIVIDALMGLEDPWSLKSLEIEELVDKIIEAKKVLGYGRARLVVDSLSAFWLDRPAMARKYSYFVKKVLAKWGFTILVTSQYAITTSLDYDEPIALRRNGHTVIMPIGKFVDDVTGDGDICDISNGEWEALSFNPKDFKLSWKPVLKTIRHKIYGKLYEVRLETGRRIRVSSDHSLFVLERCEILPKSTEELKVCDYVLIPSALPLLPKNNSANIDLIKEVAKFKDLLPLIYVHNVPPSVVKNPQLKKLIKEKYAVGSDTTRYYWKTRRVFPLTVLLEAGIVHSDLTECLISIISRSDRGGVFASHPIRSRLLINDALLRLLGYYIAEGQMRENSVILTFNINEEGYAIDALTCVENLFGIKPKMYHRSGKIDVIIYNKFIRILLKRVFDVETGAQNKRIPPIVFQVARKLQLEFLIGLYRGDGYYRASRGGGSLTLTSISAQLASDLAYLLLGLGVIASINTRSKGGFNVNVDYGRGRTVLANVIEALGKSPILEGRDSRFLGIPKTQVVPLLKGISYFNGRRGTYTHLNKVRTSRKRVLNEIFYPATLRWRTQVLERLSQASLNVKDLMALSGESESKCRNTLERLCAQGLVRGDVYERCKTYRLTERGRWLLKKIKMLKKIVESDFAFVKVRGVYKLKVNEVSVYDLSIAGNENFVGGFGGVICHNSDAFGFGVEHIADGILRFRRFVRGGVLRRFLLVEKMRQTPHSLVMHEITVVDGRGLVVIGPTQRRREDVALPAQVAEKIVAAQKSKEAELETVKVRTLARPRNTLENTKRS